MKTEFSGEGFSCRLLGFDDRSALQELCEAASDYFEITGGDPPGQAEAQSLFTVLPKGKTYDDKFVFGVFAHYQLAGVIDLIKNCPDAETWNLGLLLLDPRFRSQGLGQRVISALKIWIAKMGGSKIRLGVVDGHDRAERFWRRNSFAEMSRKSMKVGRLERQIIVMELPLSIQAKEVQSKPPC